MPILRQEYNSLLKRWSNAFDYLQKPNANVEKWLPEYIEICNRLNEIVTELRRQGIVPTNERLMCGL